MDFSFVAEAVGHVASCATLCCVIPTLAAAVLIALDKMTIADVKEILGMFKKNKRKF